MRTGAFDFELPEELIALRPAEPRESARLLQAKHGTLSHHVVGDLPSLLQPGDLCVFNNTKVIRAQLPGWRLPRAGGDASIKPKIDVTLHKRAGPAIWKAFAKPGRKLTVGDRLGFAGDLSAEIIAKEPGGEIGLLFNYSDERLNEAVEAAGIMPLPPYIAARRAIDASDDQDYQTVFAEREGSVAAPTAGLHFTQTLLDGLKARGVESAQVTLHVGAGTFLPVKTEDISSHKMHAEWGEVSLQTVKKVERTKAAGGRVIAIGTTSLRLLESAALGGKLAPFSGDTDIFITPGFRFRVADLLWTNFHLPKSTLFMLVSAFAGLAQMKDAYREAMTQKYRFYSYGDASLLYRTTP